MVALLAQVGHGELMGHDQIQLPIAQVVGLFEHSPQQDQAVEANLDQLIQAACHRPHHGIHQHLSPLFKCVQV